MALLRRRTMALAGRKGKASTVEIERADGTIDFGFYASVRGLPGDPQAPDLELLVLTDGKRAREKGITPLDKKAFLRLSRDIAETVRLRK